MSGGTAARNSRVQFTKTSCYLCSEWLGDEEVEVSGTEWVLYPLISLISIN